MNSFFFFFDRKGEREKKSRCKNLVGTKGRKRGKEEKRKIRCFPAYPCMRGNQIALLGLHIFVQMGLVLGSLCIFCVYKSLALHFQA